MKISEVEELVGITKKNIRFYEAQGLLEPGRNHENGYRDYSENDVHVLEQIKLMRKLGLPLEEIRMMQAGRSTIADSMRRHLVTLQREQQNLEESMRLCETLCQQEGMLTDLDAQQILQQMESMEKGGTSFHDIEQKDYPPAFVSGCCLRSSCYDFADAGNHSIYALGIFCGSERCSTAAADDRTDRTASSDHFRSPFLVVTTYRRNKKGGSL